MSAARTTDVAVASWEWLDEQPKPANPNAIPNANGRIVQIMFLLLREICLSMPHDRRANVHRAGPQVRDRIADAAALATAVQCFGLSAAAPRVTLAALSQARAPAFQEVAQ
jgi:hypothetical protein